MVTEVIVASIAAVVSLVVATISLIAAITTNRLSAKTSASIEVLKQSLADSSKAREFADTELLATIDALKHAMQAIQNVKDEIQLIDSSIEDSLDSSEAISRVQKSRNSLVDVFQEEHALFDATEHSALHRAKNASIELCTVVQQSLRGQAHASALADDTRLRLREIRAQLTDAQNLLRDSRGDRIVGRTLRKG